MFRRALEEGLIDAHRSVQVGLRGSLYSAQDLEENRGLGFTTVLARQLDEIGVAGALRVAAERLRSPVYVTVDIDVLDPAFAPGTGTPEAGGLSSRELLAALRGLAELDLDVAGADLVEVSPPYDPAGATAVAGRQRCLRAGLPARSVRLVSRRYPRAVATPASPVLSDTQLATLAEHGEERTAAAGDVLYRIGDQSYPFIAIPRGRGVHSGTNAGHEGIVTPRAPQGFLGEAESPVRPDGVSDRGRHPAHALHRVEREALRPLLTEDGPLGTCCCRHS